jgi:hypothetical protein
MCSVTFYSSMRTCIAKIQEQGMIRCNSLLRTNLQALANTSPGVASHCESPAFFVSLTFRPSIPTSYHPLFLSTIFSPRLMHLKEVYFCQDRPDSIDPLNPTLVSFVSSQQFVESLVATDSALSALLKISNIHSIPFPCLHSIKLWADDPGEHKFHVSQSLVGFLSSRRVNTWA